MAGWIGLWVTALNLLPVGQLDGGHIFYAMFGKRAVWIAGLAFFGIIPLGFLWNGWLIWAVLLLFWVRLRHPPTINDKIKLTPGRWAVGIFSIVMFILTFIPVPFDIT
jgi:membrane-associated protease RseP (regulator of RpoE activity)